MAAGHHTLTWNGQDGDGRDVASGVYFVRVLARGLDETHKIMCIR